MLQPCSILWCWDRLDALFLPLHIHTHTLSLQLLSPKPSQARLLSKHLTYTRTSPGNVLPYLHQTLCCLKTIFAP